MWKNIHNASRNIRPYCGDWAARFKSLDKKAKPTKDTLDWEPIGTIWGSNAAIKRMHDRGLILTIKMFMPLNHDVQSRNARISFQGKDGDFIRERTPTKHDDMTIISTGSGPMGSQERDKDQWEDRDWEMDQPESCSPHLS